MRDRSSNRCVLLVSVALFPAGCGTLGTAESDPPALYINEIMAENGYAAIDPVTFGPQASDLSYGRLPDGGSTWKSLSGPTPRRANQ